MKKIIATFLLSLMTLASASSGGTVTTVTIAKDVMMAALNNPTGNFLNWRITGMCVWQHWSIWGPYYTKTWEVNEFLPDTIISVFNRVGDNPVFYQNTILDPLLKKLGDKIAHSVVGFTPEAGSDNASSRNDSTLSFKEVDVMGDPMAEEVDRIFPNMMIPTMASPYQPYYSSLLDSIEWRDPKADLVIALSNPTLYAYTVGLTDEWGTLYPRNGYVIQPGDFKAAGVNALRASDIATVSGVGHVYTPLPTGSCGEHCTIEPRVETSINNFSEAKYQEIYPVSSTSASEQFGTIDPPMGTTNQDQYVKGGGNYVWVMWRHYSGCIQGGGKLFAVL